jgi:hypothetical protein
MMFQRRTRNAFPAGRIFLLAAAIAVLLWILQKNRQPEPVPAPEPAPTAYPISTQ